MGQVLENIKRLDLKKENQQQQRSKLLNYYKTNQSRMNYKEYRTMGAKIIGSGAIEAANREVEKNETIKAKMDYLWSSKYACLENYKIEWKMEQGRKTHLPKQKKCSLKRQNVIHPAYH